MDVGGGVGGWRGVGGWVGGLEEGGWRGVGRGEFGGGGELGVGWAVGGGLGVEGFATFSLHNIVSVCDIHFKRTDSIKEDP